MKDARNDLTALPKLPERGYGRWGKKGSGIGKAFAVILAAALVLAAVAGIGGRMNSRAAVALQASAVEASEVKKGSISATVSGTGTLAANDTEDVELLSLVSVDTVYVEAGDRVTKGQRLASVDPLSVRQALAEVQEKLDQVDSELEEAQDDKVESVIESNISGRVKKIYGEKGDSVAEVMQEQGALMLLSLDGKMAVTVETDKEMAVGDTVQVTLQDSGKEMEGTVAAASGRTLTVTLSDNGTEYGSEVQVYDGDTWLGAGMLRINSELKVTGYAGTIETVKVSENQTVKDGTDLYKLTDLPHTAEYERLVAERAELADTLQELIGLYADGNIYAEKDGTIQSVNCGDAKTVKDSKTAQAAEAEEENDGTSAGNDTAENSGTSKGDGGSAGGGENGSADFTGTGGTVGQAGVKTMAYMGQSMPKDSGAAAVIRTGSTTGTGLETEETDNEADAPSQTGAGSGDVSEQTEQGTDNAGSSTDQGTKTGANGQESDSSSGTGNTDGAGTVDGSSPNTGQTDGSAASDDDSSSGGTERLAITSLSAVTIVDPVAGEKVQQELIIAGSVGYEGTLTWSPRADETYAEETAYTATVKLKAREGYFFDMAHIQAGQTAISNGNGGKTILTGIKKAESDGSAVTFTIVYPKTGDEASKPDGNVSGEAGNASTARQSAGSFSWSGGSGSVSASAYSAKNVSGTSADTSDDSTGEAENSDTAHTVVFTQSADERMAVTVSVDELDILSLQEGQTARVTLDAIENESFEGTVAEINTLSDTSGNGVTKYSAIVVLVRTEKMLAGMNASVTVTVSEAADCLVIPEEALNEYGNRVTVYTAYDEDTGELSGETEVSTGVSNGASVEITEGLAEGDTVYYRVSTDNESGASAPFLMTGPADMPGGDGREERRGDHGSGGRPDMGGGTGEAR